MAITNFGELKAKLSRYEFHQRFAPDYVDLTTLVENAANRRLRVRQMEALVTIQTATGAATLQPDYLAWRTVLFVPGTDPEATTETEIDYVHPAYLRAAQVRDGNARVFTIENNEFQTSVVPGDVDIYRFHYYQKIPTITGSDTDTNWLLTAYSDAYLFGVLSELGALGRNLEMAQLYKARRDEVFAEIIQLSALTTGATSARVREAEFF